MKIAYLVLAHNNPRHLARLIEALSSDDCAFLIHIDRKSSIGAFQQIVGDKAVFLKKRVAIHWGDFSMVEATLLLLAEAFAGSRAFDYFVLLSGGDYPLQPTTYIEAFFAKNRGREFINLVPMPSATAGKPLSRLITYRYRPVDPSLIRIVRKGMVKIGLASNQRDYKAFLGNLMPYGGSQWWALSRPACELILRFVDNEPRVMNFFRHTAIPDEMVFQTILGNSPLAANVHRNVTFTDWSGGEASPALISERHLERFRSASPVILDDVYGRGEALFARKFADQSAAIVDDLDRLRHEREGSVPGLIGNSA